MRSKICHGGLVYNLNVCGSIAEQFSTNPRGEKLIEQYSDMVFVQFNEYFQFIILISVLSNIDTKVGAPDRYGKINVWNEAGFVHAGCQRI